MNEAELVEMFHEDADAGPRCTDHLGQAFFCDLWNQPLELIRLAELCHQQQYPRQAIFAGVEELVEKVGLGLPGANEEIINKYLGEGPLLVQRAKHLLPLYLHCFAAVD